MTNHNETNDHAPALMRHQFTVNGGLTANDLGMTIFDQGGHAPIGIYMGEWKPSWGMGRRFNVYAAMTDARDINGERLRLTFDKSVEYMNEQPESEKLTDSLDMPYEHNLRARLMELSGGERTKQIIPPLDLVGGIEKEGAPVSFKTSLVQLKGRGDFLKGNNHGFDSRLAPQTDKENSWYRSATHLERFRPVVFCWHLGLNYGGGVEKMSMRTCLRTVSVELQPG